MRYSLQPQTRTAGGKQRWGVREASRHHSHGQREVGNRLEWRGGNVDVFESCITLLRTLNYGNYGIFLIMGNAGFISGAVGTVVGDTDFQ